MIRLEPLIPKVMLFEFEKTRVPVETLCVPALIPKGVSGVAATVAEAVMVEPFNPNVTLFELENTTVPAVTEPAPFTATTGSRETLAVIRVEPLRPNVTPFESLKTIVPLVAV